MEIFGGFKKKCIFAAENVWKSVDIYRKSVWKSVKTIVISVWINA